MSNPDIKAIKELRDRDAKAAKAGDFETLRSIMSDEAVVLPPGGKPQVGKADIDAAFAEISQAPKTYEVLEYTFDLSEPEIIGSFAFEYGAIRGATRNLKDGKIEQSIFM
jgi:ketosteroid isomerase-like protein